MEILERFMRHVSKSESGCWEWAAAKYPNGYGKFKLATGVNGGRGVLAHRFIYEFVYGPISNVINHKCENKACVNPTHLEDVTQQANVQYSLSNRCKRGHDLNGADVGHTKDGKRQCLACRRERRAMRPRAGDIGEPIKHIELEPVETPFEAPVTVPEPEKVPA